MAAVVRRSRAGLKVRASEQTAACDYCRHTFLASELTWVSEEWIIPETGRCGHVTATLCPDCNKLALAHCWGCGALTGRADDVSDLRRRTGAVVQERAMSELVAAAIRYLPRTIPLEGKRPAVGADWPSWPATRGSVTDWWRRHPSSNVGIRTGAGLVALDVGAWDNGEQTLAELERENGRLPEAPTVVTGSGGRHIYFRGPRDLRSRDLRSRNLRSIGLAGLEIAAAGRQLVAPPSVHPGTGKLYVWHSAHPLIGSELAQLPDWLAKLAGHERAPRGPARDDPLREIPATVYVPLLLERELGRDGKTLCPFHHEAEPSLHAYDGDRGWFCYGCGRGGTIIDLGAHLWGVEPRGRDFNGLRRRLASELLARAS